jgi:hypothetical protein
MQDDKLSPDEIERLREIMKNGTTTEEAQKLREIIQQDDRMNWLYRSTLKVATWIFGIAAAIVAFRSDLSALYAWYKGPTP